MAVRNSRQPEARRRHRKDTDWKVQVMKGWMKRRIERSRERCERAETELREAKTRNGNRKETEDSTLKIAILSPARAA